MKLVLATENAHKVSEIRAILAPLVPGLELLSLADLSEDMTLPEETGETFEANALLKAVYAARSTGLPSIGDDSGLCVDALNGGPGIHSRRWAGESATDADRIAKLLAALIAVGADRQDARGARFVSAAVLAYPGGETFKALGECHGVILGEPRGTQGFGYDPVFFLPQEGRTMAELSANEKNAVSHRAHAMRGLAAFLRARA